MDKKPQEKTLTSFYKLIQLRQLGPVFTKR